MSLEDNVRTSSPALSIVSVEEPSEALFTIKEAAAYLLRQHGAKFSVSWLYREAGVTVPCVRPKPRMLRFKRSELDRWIAQMKG